MKGQGCGGRRGTVGMKGGEGLRAQTSREQRA